MSRDGEEAHLSDLCDARARNKLPLWKIASVDRTRQEYLLSTSSRRAGEGESETSTVGIVDAI